jgi:hypothetical protein
MGRTFLVGFVIYTLLMSTMAVAICFFLGKDLIGVQDVNILPKPGTWGINFSFAATIFFYYLLTRSIVSVIFVLTLFFCAKYRFSPWKLITIGMTLPVILEFVAARPYTSSWAGMFLALLYYLPNVPRWLGPPDTIILTTLAHLIPPFVAGAITTSWLYRSQYKTKAMAPPAARLP